MNNEIIITSNNPVKINAAKDSFSRMFPREKFSFTPLSVASGVPDQPLNSDETLQGALNRVTNAQKKCPQAKFWVGIEGGIEKLNEEIEAFAWIIICSHDRQGKAKTGTFYLPDKMVELINSGSELGEADDIVFGNKNSKQKNGTVGALTGNLITRTTYYSEAMILALIPFKNPSLYS